MNREQIEKRLNDLLESHDKLSTQIITVEGAIQDCHYWLAQLAAEEAKAPEPKEGKVKK